MLRCLQGNRAGVVGCGFWNDDCGGLNLALVWQIVYCIIFGLVVVIFPFFIFFYEADDEGLAAEDAARASGGSTCMVGTRVRRPPRRAFDCRCPSLLHHRNASPVFWLSVCRLGCATSAA